MYWGPVSLLLGVQLQASRGEKEIRYYLDIYISKSWFPGSQERLSYVEKGTSGWENIYISKGKIKNLQLNFF